MKSVFLISLGLLCCVLGTSLAAAAGGARLIGDPENLKTQLEKMFTNRDAKFYDSRHPTSGAADRNKMLVFIQNRLQLLQVLAGQKGLVATNESLPFQTDIMVSQEHRAINGTNVVFVLQGTSNVTEDQPIMLLANYDTAENTNNVNEGSGVAALLVLLETILQNLNTEGSKYVLRHSIVFAFTDVSHRKYVQYGQTVGTSRGETGAQNIATTWLPRYLENRKSFKGVVVLDNLLNYNSTAKSQLVQNTNLDKTFPDAYQKIAYGNFAGDFIGLVTRENDLDSPLASAVEQAWTSSGQQTKNPVNTTITENSPYLDAKLLRFTFNKETFSSAAASHFLASEQYSFWNEHPNIIQKQYPAITLTDTRSFRQGCRSLCYEPVSPASLKFMARTVRTLQHLIVNQQTDGNGAFNVQTSAMLMSFSVILVLLFGRS